METDTGQTRTTLVMLERIPHLFYDKDTESTEVGWQLHFDDGESGRVFISTTSDFNPLEDETDWNELGSALRGALAARQ